MMTIPLTKGHFAIVDDDDFEWLSAFTWTADVRPAGHVYARRVVQRKGRKIKIYMHELLVPVRPGFMVDHRDGDGLDNRRQNLRVATKGQNNANSRPRRRLWSKYRGVTWDKAGKVWKAQIRAGGKQHNLGRFSTEEEAHAAYVARAKELHGEFARFD